jgi:SAM-dependent methyltransferase
MALVGIAPMQHYGLGQSSAGETVKSLVRAFRQRPIPLAKDVGQRGWVASGSMTLDAYLERIAGNRFMPAPPNHLLLPDTEIASFRRLGALLVGRLVDEVGLEPHHNVVDIGSGIGRVAIPLTQYLTAKGSYHGLEVIKPAVEWCKSNISSSYENFQFTHLDVHNPHYNRRGRLTLKEVVMPIKERSADVVFLASVFTHIGEEDAIFYVHQIARMLKPGGRLWSTWFLLDEETKELVRAGKTTFEKQNTNLTGAVTHELLAKHPGAAVAYDESFVLGTMASAGLNPKVLSRGAWCQRRRPDRFNQDVVVAERPR